MSDQNLNPYIEAKADKHSEPVTRADCWFDHNEEDALYDAYLILRDAGYSQDDLQPLLNLINRTTIYDATAPEWFYNEFVTDE